MRRRQEIVGEEADALVERAEGRFAHHSSPLVRVPPRQRPAKTAMPRSTSGSKAGTLCSSKAGRRWRVGTEPRVPQAQRHRHPCAPRGRPTRNARKPHALPRRRRPAGVMQRRRQGDDEAVSDTMNVTEVTSPSAGHFRNRTNLLARFGSPCQRRQFKRPLACRHCSPLCDSPLAGAEVNRSLNDPRDSAVLSRNRARHTNQTIP